MAGRRPVPPRRVPALQLPEVEDEATQRALDAIAAHLARPSGGRVVIEDVDLVVGTNKIPHGLGRRCVGYSLTVATANATFAHAIDRSNPRPDLEVWITVIGVAQDDAVLEVF